MARIEIDAKTIAEHVRLLRESGGASSGYTADLLEATGAQLHSRTSDDHLVTELRQHERNYPSLIHGPLCGRAADEIERLRAISHPDHAGPK